MHNRTGEFAKVSQSIILFRFFRSVRSRPMAISITNSETTTNKGIFRYHFPIDRYLCDVWRSDRIGDSVGRHSFALLFIAWFRVCLALLCGSIVMWRVKRFNTHQFCTNHELYNASANRLERWIVLCLTNSNDIYRVDLSLICDKSSRGFCLFLFLIWNWCLCAIVDRFFFARRFDLGPARRRMKER